MNKLRGVNCPKNDFVPLCASFGSDCFCIATAFNDYFAKFLDKGRFFNWLLSPKNSSALAPDSLPQMDEHELRTLLHSFKEAPITRI